MPGLYPQIARPQRSRYSLRSGLPRIDWSHPLAQGLVGYYLPGISNLDLAGKQGSATTVSGNGSPPYTVPTMRGPATQFNNGSYFALSPAPVLGGRPNFSIVTQMQPRIGFTDVPYSEQPGGNDLILFGPTIFWYRNDAGNLAQLSFVNSSTTMGSFYTLGCTFSSAALKTYWNGALDNTLAFGHNTTWTGTSVTKFGNGFGGGAAQNYTFLALYARTLTDADQLSLHLNPFQFLIFPEDRLASMLVGTGGVTNYFLSVALGSFSLTGEAAIHELTRRVGAAQGSFALTGEATGLVNARRAVAVEGSFTLTGEAAALRAARELSMAQGSFGLTGEGAGFAIGAPYGFGAFTLTGESAGLLHASNLAMGQGSFSLTGEDAGLSKGGDFTLSVDDGLFTLTGEAALGAIAMLMAQGSYSLTGEPVGLRNAPMLNSAFGAFTFTGEALGLKYGHVVAASYGAFSLTGEDAVLEKSGSFTILASEGGFTLSGQASGLVSARRLAMGQGAFSLTGEAGGLRRAFTNTAGFGAFSLSGQLAALIAARHLILNTGTYGLAGEVAGLRAARELLMAYGSFGLTGEDANFVYTVASRLTAQAGLFALAGQTVGLRAIRHMVVAPGLFVLTGISSTGTHLTHVVDFVELTDFRLRAGLLAGLALRGGFIGNLKLE